MLGTSEKDLSAVAGLLEKSRLKAAPTEEDRFGEFDAFRVSSCWAVWRFSLVGTNTGNAIFAEVRLITYCYRGTS